MKRKELNSLLEQRKLTQQAFADLLNASLDTHYRRQDVNKWTTGARPVPKLVAMFIVGHRIKPIRARRAAAQ